MAGQSSEPAGTTLIVSFFAAFWVILVIGVTVHVLVDRHRHGRQPHRTLELLLLWVVVFGGIWTILAGHGLVSGQAHKDAVSGGYAPSMYEWEVGWADIAIGVLGVACIRKALRGMWMTAAVVVLAISFLGDAIGHLMQWVAHGNSDPANVWAIPFGVAQATFAVLLLVFYRRVDKPPQTPDAVT